MNKANSQSMACSDDIYYRIIQSEDGTLAIACIQWFDEPDYDHSRYFTDVHFATEDDAQAIIDAIYALIGKAVMRGKPHE